MKEFLRKWFCVAQNNSGVGCFIREYGVLMLGDNPETGEDVALKLVQEGFAKVRLRFLSTSAPDT